MDSATLVRTRSAARVKSRSTLLRTRIVRERWMYLFILPGFVYFVVFRYVPFLGNVIAFQDYSPFVGFSSPWVGLDNFAKLFTDPDLLVAFNNTLAISVLQLIFFFPAPIILALLLNSMVSEPAKRFMQSVLYLPHFISWVIIIALWQQLFGGAGSAQSVPPRKWPAAHQHHEQRRLLQAAGGAGVDLEGDGVGHDHHPRRAHAHRSDAVRGRGDGRRQWLAAAAAHHAARHPRGDRAAAHPPAGDDPQYGFEQMFLQRNAVGAPAAEVLDTFLYFRGIQGGDWGFSAAVGLVKGVFAAVLVFSANRVAKALGDEGAF